MGSKNASEVKQTKQCFEPEVLDRGLSENRLKIYKAIIYIHFIFYNKSYIKYKYTMYYNALGCGELKNKKLKTKVYLSAETDHLSFTFWKANI